MAYSRLTSCRGCLSDKSLGLAHSSFVEKPCLTCLCLCPPPPPFGPFLMPTFQPFSTLPPPPIESRYIGHKKKRKQKAPQKPSCTMHNVHWHGLTGCGPDGIVQSLGLGQSVGHRHMSSHSRSRRAYVRTIAHGRRHTARQLFVLLKVFAIVSQLSGLCFQRRAVLCQLPTLFLQAFALRQICDSAAAAQPPASLSQYLRHCECSIPGGTNINTSIGDGTNTDTGNSGSRSTNANTQALWGVGGDLGPKTLFTRRVQTKLSFNKIHFPTFIFRG